MIAIHGVVDGSVLEIEDETAAAIIDGVGFIQLAIDRVPAIGQAINAVTVFELAYHNINHKSALVRKIINTVCSFVVSIILTICELIINAKSLSAIPIHNTRPSAKKL